MTYPKYLIQSDIAEAQVEAFVACFLGWITPAWESPVRLFAVDEATSGADKLYDSGCALYLQFKKSLGLKPWNSITRKNQSPLCAVREFRSESGLKDDPTLFFQLRRKSKTSTDFQHNVLRAYINPPVSHAVYVAPLALSRSEYYQKLFHPRSLMYLPFEFNRWILIHARGKINIQWQVPILRAHISIVPHERVTSSDHYYSFALDGSDVAWHSPEVISRNEQLLSSWLLKRLEGAILQPKSLPTISALAQSVAARSGAYKYDGLLTAGNELDFLSAHGKWLRREFSIHQYLLLVNSRDLLRQGSS